MNRVTVVIPNFNGIDYVQVCLDALMHQTITDYAVLVVDNGSTDGSLELIREQYPQIQVIAFPENKGFCTAVNAGIKAAQTPYVILLNNDTQVESAFVEELLTAISASEQIFSCAAKMLQYQDRTRIDDAGDLYSALGWAFARGKDKKDQGYDQETEVFSACAGAAIYRRAIFEEIGYFDERHFAYLEDVDLGYRARIYGYVNRYAPKARVYHIGSASTGSRHNVFKVSQAARNGVYMNYKNMPLPQLILNAPLLGAGMAVKQLYFIKKHLGRAYMKGILAGFQMCKKSYKVPYNPDHFHNYVKIQCELWTNMSKRGL